MFYESYIDDNKWDTYRLAKLDEQTDNLFSLWLQTRGDLVQIAIGYEKVTAQEKADYMQKTARYEPDETQKKPVPSPSGNVDTKKIEEGLQSTIRKSFPDVRVRVRAEQGTVHFYFDIQRETQDADYLNRLVFGAVALAGVTKIMYDSTADWSTSKTYFTFREVVISWIYTVDCEQAVEIDDVNERADFLAPRIHWVRR
jgi:hypothetical protein